MTTFCPFILTQPFSALKAASPSKAAATRLARPGLFLKPDVISSVPSASIVESPLPYNAC